jgi:hypothetical protein
LDDNGSAAEFLRERKRRREAEARLPPEASEKAIFGNYN